MPFPWKKNRVKSISQIVADLQSPKHGGSLVVETGFPTSLIDLFVKNKGRFRKPKNKKRFQVEITGPVRETPAAVSPPPPPSSPQTSNLSDRTACSDGPLLRRRDGEDVGGAVSGQYCDPVRESDDGSDSNMVLSAVLEMFVVVVLTLCMNKLTVGITMSAFVIFFLEFIGKQVFRFLKPCSNANKNFKSLAQRVSNSIWVQKLVMAFNQSNSSDSESSVSPVVDEEHLVLGVESSYPPTCIEEIEIVETESDDEKGIPHSAELDSITKEHFPHSAEHDSITEEHFPHSAELDSITEEHLKLRIVEILEKESDEYNKDKRSSKLKSKIVKKLLPKKLRGSKREKKNKQREGESSLPSSESARIREESERSRRSEMEEGQNDTEKEEHGNGHRPPLLLPRKLECIEDADGIACSNESPLLKGEDDQVTMSNSEKRVDRVGNSGYIILFLIALAGLIVGRFLALLLIMAWFFMLKMVKSGRVAVNLPLVRCSIAISGRALDHI